MKFTDFHNTKLAEASKTRNPTRDFLRNNPVSPDQMAKPVKQMSVPELAAVSDEALDKAYGYGRSTPTNTFGWQANLASASYAKQKIDKGVTDIEAISDAIHKGWWSIAQKFVDDPDQFDDTETLRAKGKFDTKMSDRIAQMVPFGQLTKDQQDIDRVVARALLQAIKGQQGVAEASNTMQRYGQKIIKRAREARAAEAREKAEKEKAEQEKADKEKNKGVAEATSVIRADFAKDQGRYTNDTKPDVGGVSMTRIKVGDTVHYHGAKVEVLELDRAKDYARVEGGGRTMNVPLSKLQQYGQGVAEGYWDDAVKAIEKASKERAGKPFEKNPASHDKSGVYRGDKDLAGNPVPKHKEPGVAEAKADPLGAWIAHKNGTEARKFKTREGAKKYVASHEGFTVSSSEAFHDTYRKKKVQEVKKFRTTYGWAGGSKEPREDKVAKHNSAVAKLPNGHAHRSNHPDLLKKAPKGYFFNISHKLVPDKQGVAEGMFTKAPAIDPTIGKQINNIINRLYIRAKQTKDEYLLVIVQELFDILRNTGGTYSAPGSPGVRDVAEGEKWIQKAVNPKTKGDLHKALRVPQDETIPKSRIAQAIHSTDPHLRHMAQFAKNVAKEDAGGMGTGSVATSMGAGNGFANGGPGTITRRRK